MRRGSNAARGDRPVISWARGAPQRNVGKARRGAFWRIAAGSSLFAAAQPAGAAITAAMSRMRTRTAVLVVASALASAVAFVQVPLISGALHLAPLHLDDWQFAVAGGLAIGALSLVFSWASARS